MNPPQTNRTEPGTSVDDASIETGDGHGASLKRPNLWTGVQCVFEAFGFIRRNPDAWPTAMVPTVVFILLSAFGVFAGINWLRPEVIVALGLDQPETWYTTGLAWLIHGLVSVASVVTGVWAAFAITPPLSAPALEHLVSLKEAELGLPPRKPIGLLREILCGLKAQLFAAIFAVPALALLWLVNLVFPPAAIVTLPLKALVIALAVSWNLIDYPLTLRGVSPGDRLGFVAAHKFAVVGFGLAMAALFWVPCLGVVLLPVGAVGATRLVWRMVESEPEVLAELPSPKPAAFSALSGQTDAVSASVEAESPPDSWRSD